MNLEQILGTSDYSLDAFLIAAAAGIIIAMLVVLWNKSVCGGFVRFLVKKGITSPEKAVTLKEAGSGKNLLLRLALRKGSTLSKLVKMTEQEGEKRYYLPGEHQEQATLVYNNKGTNPISIVIAIGLVIACAFLVRFLVPNLTQMLENFIDIVKNPDGN